MKKYAEMIESYIPPEEPIYINVTPKDGEEIDGIFDDFIIEDDGIAIDVEEIYKEGKYAQTGAIELIGDLLYASQPPYYNVNDPNSIINYDVFLIDDKDGIRYVNVQDGKLIDLQTNEEYKNDNSENIKDAIERFANSHPKAITDGTENGVEVIERKTNGEDTQPKICLIKMDYEICNKYGFDPAKLRSIIETTPSLTSKDFFYGLKAVTLGAVMGINVQFSPGQTKEEAIEANKPRLQEKINEVRIEVAERNMRIGEMKVAIDCAQSEHFIDFGKDTNRVVENLKDIGKGGMYPQDLLDYAKFTVLMERLKGLSVSAGLVKSDMLAKSFTKEEDIEKEDIQALDKKISDYDQKLNDLMDTSHMSIDGMEDIIKTAKNLSSEIEPKLSGIIKEHNQNVKFDTIDIKHAFGVIYRKEINQIINNVSDGDISNTPLTKKIGIDLKEINIEHRNITISGIENNRRQYTTEAKTLNDLKGQTNTDKDDISSAIKEVLQNKFEEKYSKGEISVEDKAKIDNYILKSKHIDVVSGVMHDRHGTVITRDNIDNRTISDKIPFLHISQQVGAYIAPNGVNATKAIIDRMLGIGKSSFVGNVYQNAEDYVFRNVGDSDKFELHKEKVLGTKEVENKTDTGATSDEASEKKFDTGTASNETTTGESANTGATSNTTADESSGESKSKKRWHSEKATNENTDNETRGFRRSSGGQRPPTYDADGNPIDDGNIRKTHPVVALMVVGTFLAFLANPLFGIAGVGATIAVARKIGKKEKENVTNDNQRANHTEKHEKDNNNIDKNKQNNADNNNVESSKEKEPQETKTEDKVEKKPFHEKVKDYGEVVKNIREMEKGGGYKDRIMTDRSFGVHKSYFDLLVSKDVRDSMDIKRDNMSKGLHNISDVIGKIYDKVSHDRATTARGDFYEKTRDIRVVDEMKGNLGIEGESFKSAANKFGAVVSGFLHGRTASEINAATNGVFRGGVIATGFRLLSNISLSAIKIERSPIFAEKAKELSRPIDTHDTRQEMSKDSLKTDVLNKGREDIVSKYTEKERENEDKAEKYKAEKVSTEEGRKTAQDTKDGKRENQTEAKKPGQVDGEDPYNRDGQVGSEDDNVDKVKERQGTEKTEDFKNDGIDPEKEDKTDNNGKGGEKPDGIKRPADLNEGKVDKAETSDKPENNKGSNSTGEKVESQVKEGTAGTANEQTANDDESDNVEKPETNTEGGSSEKEKERLDAGAVGDAVNKQIDDEQKKDDNADGEKSTNKDAVSSESTNEAAVGADIQAADAETLRATNTETATEQENITENTTVNTEGSGETVDTNEGDKTVFIEAALSDSDFDIRDALKIYEHQMGDETEAKEKLIDGVVAVLADEINADNMDPEAAKEKVCDIVDVIYNPKDDTSQPDNDYERHEHKHDGLTELYDKIDDEKSKDIDKYDFILTGYDNNTDNSLLDSISGIIDGAKELFTSIGTAIGDAIEGIIEAISGKTPETAVEAVAATVDSELSRDATLFDAMYVEADYSDPVDMPDNFDNGVADYHEMPNDTTQTDYQDWNNQDWQQFEQPDNSAFDTTQAAQNAAEQAAAKVDTEDYQPIESPREGYSENPLTYTSEDIERDNGD